MRWAVCQGYDLQGAHIMAGKQTEGLGAVVVEGHPDFGSGGEGGGAGDEGGDALSGAKIHFLFWPGIVAAY